MGIVAEYSDFLTKASGWTGSTGIALSRPFYFAPTTVKIPFWNSLMNRRRYFTRPHKHLWFDAVPRSLWRWICGPKYLNSQNVPFIFARADAKRCGKISRIRIPHWRTRLNDVNAFPSSGTLSSFFWSSSRNRFSRKIFCFFLLLLSVSQSSDSALVVEASASMTTTMVTLMLRELSFMNKN